MSVETACRPVSATLESSVRYEIRDHFAVPPLAQGSRLDAWCPVISDTPYQRVLDVAVHASVPWELKRDAREGNPMLHVRLTRPQAAETRFEIRYVVERNAVAHMLHPACVRPLENPGAFAAYLGPEQFVAVDDKMRKLAAEVTRGESNTLLQAQALYEHVVGSMSYDAAQQSWTGSSEHALVCAVGNCNDIHALFISLARSLGIPARLVLGQALEPPAPGQEACDLCGYHCWAEFFAAGLGWVPVDASCACKYGKHNLFGGLEINHIAWSVGRDLTLAPPQEGPPVLFFAGPYAERDGKPLRLERHVTFVQF